LISSICLTKITLGQSSTIKLSLQPRAVSVLVTQTRNK
jgi:hypothetical protein